MSLVPQNIKYPAGRQRVSTRGLQTFKQSNKLRSIKSLTNSARSLTFDLHLKQQGLAKESAGNKV
jgi:hypothetical protein